MMQPAVSLPRGGFVYTVERLPLKMAYTHLPTNLRVWVSRAVGKPTMATKMLTGRSALLAPRTAGVLRLASMWNRSRCLSHQSLGGEWKVDLPTMAGDLAK